MDVMLNYLTKGMTNYCTEMAVYYPLIPSKTSSSVVSYPDAEQDPRPLSGVESNYTQPVNYRRGRRRYRPAPA